MAKTGRPSKLTPELTVKLCNFLKLGNYRETAALACGIGVSTFYEWLQQGREDIANEHNSPFAEFAEAVEKADAEGEASLMLTIKGASSENWQAAAWMLERKNPQRYGRVQRVALEADPDSKEAPFVIVVPAKAEDEKQWAAAAKASRRAKQ